MLLSTLAERSFSFRHRATHFSLHQGAIYQDSVKLKKTKELRTRLQHLMEAKRREARRREARRKAADGALAALPTTEASTGGALSAVDAALGREEHQAEGEGSEIVDFDPAAFVDKDEHNKADHGALKSLDADLLSSMDSLQQEGLALPAHAAEADSQPAEYRSAAASSKTSAELASLDADLLFSSGSTDRPLQPRKRSAHLSQLGFSDYGQATEARPDERGPEARARFLDPPAEEEDDDECRPPMVMFEGKCIDSPSRQPRPWGLPTRRR